MSATEVEDSDLVLIQSADHPTDDTSTAGGGPASPKVVINNSFVGEWLTRMVAQATGTIDVNIELQFQKAFWDQQNGFGKNLLDAFVYVLNLLRSFDVITAGNMEFVSTDAGDNTTKKVRIHGQRNDNNLLDTEDVVLNGLTQVAGVKVWKQVFRLELLLSINDTKTTATGNISAILSDGVNPDETTGQIPSGMSWATYEFEVGMVATTGTSGVPETSSVANRKTDPGLTYSRPNTPATAIPIRNNVGNDTLNDGEHQGMWLKQTLQPGMTPAGQIDAFMFIEGDSD